MRKRQSRAQSLLEYSILVGVFAAALIAMRVFMQRSIQEKYRQSADVFGQGEQYAPGATTVESDGSGGN